MSVKNFIVKLPELCEAENAPRWAKVNELQFDHEINTKGSVFARSEKDKANEPNRFSTLFGFYGNAKKIEHCKLLCELLFLVHYEQEHGENHGERINSLASDLIIDESGFPEIMEVMSVEKALSRKGWNH